MHSDSVSRSTKKSFSVGAIGSWERGWGEIASLSLLTPLTPSQPDHFNQILAERIVTGQPSSVSEVQSGPGHRVSHSSFKSYGTKLARTHGRLRENVSFRTIAKKLSPIKHGLNSAWLCSRNLTLFPSKSHHKEKSYNKLKDKRSQQGVTKNGCRLAGKVVPTRSYFFSRSLSNPQRRSLYWYQHGGPRVRAK